MDIKNLYKTDIVSYLDKHEIIELTKQQIQKDFLAFNVEVDFEQDENYNSLHRELVAIVDELSCNNYEKLMNILYRIDISDKDLAQTTSNFPHYNYIEVVAHQIIFRELKKVLIRKYYQL